MTKPNQPVKRFRTGRINVTVWLNDGEKGSYYTINFDRRYKDAEGNYHTVTSFSRDDLKDLAMAAELAQGIIPVLGRIEGGGETEAEAEVQGEAAE